MFVVSNTLLVFGLKSKANVKPHEQQPQEVEHFLWFVFYALQTNSTHLKVNEYILTVENTF